MLKPKKIANAVPLATQGPASPIKVGSIVTKGHIRVSRKPGKPGLQVVATRDALSEPIFASNTDSQTPAGAPSQPIFGGADDALFSGDPHPSASEVLPPAGHPMKLIKLIAAAAVSGIAAITLTFLQFSGPEKEFSSQRSASLLSSNPVIAAAGAGTLPATATARASGATGQDTADLVAHITAGTLAALRNGPVKTPDKTTETSPQPAAQATGAATGAADSNGLYAMVLTALQQGQSHQYIDQLVNEAHRSDKVAVPSLLLTASGEVDTVALLTLFGKQ